MEDNITRTNLKEQVSQALALTLLQMTLILMMIGAFIYLVVIAIQQWA